MATPASETIRQKPRATTADELAVIAQRAQSFTNASGAAIAISDGSADEIVCRARSGSSAPDVGTSLRVEGSFTGLCIQSGKELRCDDAETDTRVDTSAIRALGIRSMVVTPIRDDGRVVGVLAVFAPTPHAFTITHVAVLKTMADQISNLLQRDRRTKDEPHREAQVPAAPPAPVPAPVAVSKPYVTPVPLPPPIVLKPVAGPSVATGAAAAAPARQPSAPPPPPAAPRVDTNPVALAADISVPAPFPKKELRREFAPEPVAPRASFGTFDAVAGEPAKSPAGKLMLIGAFLLIAVGAALGWMYFKSHKASPQTEAQTQPQAQAPAPVTPAPVAAATNTAPVSSPATPAASASSAASSGKADTAEKPESKKTDSKKKEAQSAPAPAPPAPTTIALGNGPSKIAQPAPQSQTEDVSPTLTVGGGSASGLASLARPVGSSAPQMVAQSDLVNAKAIHSVPAIYPELAKTRRITGTVVVKVLVGKDGKVSNPQFMSGPMIFRDAAFDAVKQWVFKPAQLNGRPIDQETEIKVIFHP